MHLDAAAAAVGKNCKVARGLSLCKFAQALCAGVFNGDILRLFCRDNQEHPFVRTALMELTGGMQVARANFQARCRTQAVGNRVADFFQRFTATFAREGEERIQAEVIAGLNAAEQSAQCGNERFV